MKKRLKSEGSEKIFLQKNTICVLKTIKSFVI